MAEQPTIIEDPISSDGSEDSWIMLDEIDEAMNDIEAVVNQAPIEAVTVTTKPKISIETAEVATETYEPSRIEEAADNDGVNGNDFEPKIETVSSDAIETCPSDDNSESEHMYSSRPYDRVLLAPTVDDGGSTTDGSISMISDTEFHRYETKPKRKYTKDGKYRLDMLMNCKPIDMTVKNPRPTVQIPGRCAMPTSVEELAMGKPCIVDVVIDLLERINNFFATTYLGQVFLLFVTIISLTSWTIMYNRYTNMRLASEKLNQKYIALELESIHLEVKIAQCERLYDHKMKDKINEPNVPTSIFAEEDHKMKISTTTPETNYYKMGNYEGAFEAELEGIQPTKLTIQSKVAETIDRTKTRSTFDNDHLQGDFVIPSIRDYHGRVVWVGEDEPENPSEKQSDFEKSDYQSCKCYGPPGLSGSDIDTEETIEYGPIEEYIPQEYDCCSDDAEKYKRPDTHIHHTATKQHKSRDESKSRKEEKKIEKTKAKWEKAGEKYDAKVGKYISPEDDFIEIKQKFHREKKLRRENENKINKNKDRKEYKEKKDKDYNGYEGVIDWTLKIHEDAERRLNNGNAGWRWS